MSTSLAQKTVNKPLDPNQRDKNVDQKLQVYGIVDAFSQGKVPTNQQIDVALNSALASKPLSNPPSTLSAEGRKLVADLREVIQQAKVLVLSKNEGNLIQDFTWQTRSVGKGDAQGVKSPVSRDDAEQHGREALEGLRTLGELLITNGQFRKLLNDATILLRDIAGDAAQKSADKVNPSEEQLSQIDQAADDHTWHEKPDLSRENLKAQAQSRSPLSKEGAKQAVGDATQAAHPSGARDPADAANRDYQAGTTGSTDPKEGARQALGNLNEEDQRRVREQKDRAMNYAKEKMPQERREQVIWRLKKMIVECQNHREYEQAIDSLLRIAEEYQGHSKDVAAQSKGAVQGGRNQGPVANAEYDLKTILERFANGTSFDDVIESINQVYRDADQDAELRGWFKNLDAYIRKCLKQTGFILEDQATREYNELYEQGRYLTREKYRSHFDRVIDEFKYVGEQFDKDPQNQAFARSLEKLFKDLGQDEGGTPTFKPHLLEDLRDVILPGFFETVGYIPVPRIEYSDNMIDAIVENIVLEGDNLFPNIFEFGSDNYWRWTRKVNKIGAQGNRNKNSAMLAVEGIQMDIRDIAYYVKKKEGFPSVTDKGVMDIFFGGNGISFKVAMETSDNKDAGRDDSHFFKINTVHIDIDKMDINLKQSNHKLLFKLFKPLLLKVMTPVVNKILEKQIRDQVHKIDGMCYEAKKEADRAAEDARRNPDPDNQQNIYQRYLTAIQHQISRAQQKKEEEQKAKPPSNAQTNVALTMHDSIFKNISLPGGWSTKATKYKDMANQGDKWQSPIFGIGSAGETRGLTGTKVSRRTGGLPKPTTQPSTTQDQLTNLGNQNTAQPPVTDQSTKVGTLDPGRTAGTEAIIGGAGAGGAATAAGNNDWVVTHGQTGTETGEGRFAGAGGHTTLWRGN